MQPPCRYNNRRVLHDDKVLQELPPAIRAQASPWLGCWLAHAMVHEFEAYGGCPRPPFLLPCNSSHVWHRSAPQVALLSCGPLLSRVPLFAHYPMLLEEVAPLLQRTVALPGGCHTRRRLQALLSLCAAAAWVGTPC